jgi:hypothetical protein
MRREVVTLRGIRGEVKEKSLRGIPVMPMKRYKTEEIVNLLRQIEVEIANRKTTQKACEEATVQHYPDQ